MRDHPEAPLVIEFLPGTTIQREQDRPSALPILGNGPPGTFVVFPTGRFRVSLPTDQIVWADDLQGRARVGFGGMAFAGVEAEQLKFLRRRELRLEHELSPARSHTMFLDRRWVVSVDADGSRIWP